MTMNAALLSLVATLSVCVSVCHAEDTTVVGGLSPTKFATEEVQDLVDMVNPPLSLSLSLSLSIDRSIDQQLITVEVCN